MPGLEASKRTQRVLRGHEDLAVPHVENHAEHIHEMNDASDGDVFVIEPVRTRCGDIRGEGRLARGREPGQALELSTDFGELVLDLESPPIRSAAEKAKLLDEQPLQLS